MGVISGIGGAVDGINTVRQWQVGSTADLQAAVASNTKGAPVVIAGNTDWQGNYGAYGHTPVRLPGESFEFKGSIDGTKGAAGTAIVEQAVITIDIESGAIIAHTVNFASAGDLTLGAAAATDATMPDPPTSIGCKAEIADPAAVPTWSELDDVRTMTLTLNRSNQTYATSATNGNIRRAKGNLSGTIAINVYTDDFSTLPVKNTVSAVRLYVNATEFWLLEWVRWGETNDLTVNIEDPNVVPASLSGQFTGFTNIVDTPTEGQIVTPDATVLWPEAA